MTNTMAGKNWKQGYLPSYERMSVEEQARALVWYVGREAARSKALGNAAKWTGILNTYPRTDEPASTLHKLALAVDYWQDVAHVLTTLTMPAPDGSVDGSRPA